MVFIFTALELASIISVRILKFPWEMKVLRIAQTFFKNKNRIRELIQPDLKT